MSVKKCLLVVLVWAVLHQATSRRVVGGHLRVRLRATGRPKITGLLPGSTSNPSDVRLTIQGQNFNPKCTVSVSGVGKCPVISMKDTEIICKQPALSIAGKRVTVSRSDRKRTYKVMPGSSNSTSSTSSSSSSSAPCSQIFYGSPKIVNIKAGHPKTHVAMTVYGQHFDSGITSVKIGPTGKLKVCKIKSPQAAGEVVCDQPYDDIKGMRIYVTRCDKKRTYRTIGPQLLASPSDPINSKPKITRLSYDPPQLTITGQHFGPRGTIKISGKVCKTVTWRDMYGTITCSPHGDMDIRNKRVYLIRVDGAKTYKTFKGSWSPSSGGTGSSGGSATNHTYNNHYGGTNYTHNHYYGGTNHTGGGSGNSSDDASYHSYNNPGYGGSNSSNSSTVKCKPGQYSYMRGHCSDCPMGTFSPTGDACRSCKPGRFQPNLGSTKCMDCVAGRFTSATSAMSCETCPPGRFQPANGAADCDECPPGRHAFATAATKCVTETDMGKIPAIMSVTNFGNYQHPMTVMGVNFKSDAKVFVGGNQGLGLDKFTVCNTTFKSERELQCVPTSMQRMYQVEPAVPIYVKQGSVASNIVKAPRT